MSLPFVLKRLPSIGVEARFGHNNSRKPSLSLISCAVFSQILKIVFSFYPRDYHVVLRFRNFCVLAYYRLRVYYKQTLRTPSFNHNRTLLPLLRILREIIDDFETSIPLEKPTAHLFVNDTRHSFFRKSDGSTFKTFLCELYVKIEKLFTAAVDENFDPYDRINEILFPLDQAYCMVLAFTYFFIPLENQIKSTDYDKTALLMSTRFEEYRNILTKRPRFHIEKQSSIDECKCQ